METEQSLREILEADRLPATPWDALQNHLERGAVLLVEDVALLDAGEAFAKDDAVQVSAWLEAGLIRRPEPADVAKIVTNGVTFEALIVQPWVLIRAENYDA